MPDSKFFREIGRQGGLAGKGSAAKKASAQAAAKARWKKHAKRPVTLTAAGSNVYFSRNVIGLVKALSMVERKRVGQDIKLKRVSFLFSDGGQTFTPLTLLHRARRFLNDEGMTCRMAWKTKPFYQRINLKLHDVLADYNYRQRRVLSSVLRQPAGSLCRADSADWDWLLCEVLRITHPARAVIVVETVTRLFKLHEHLQHHLGETVGAITDRAPESLFDQRRVVVMVPAYVSEGLIPPEEIEIVIFDRCPRKRFNRVSQSLVHFPAAWRLALLGDEKRGHARILEAESVFGEVAEVSRGLSVGKPK